MRHWLKPLGLLLAVAALVGFIHEILMDAILHGRMEAVVRKRKAKE